MKKEQGCSCPITGLPVNTILIALTLITVAVFGCFSYGKIKDLHNAFVIAQFGSQQAFDQYMEVSQSPAVVKLLTERTQSQVEQMKELTADEIVEETPTVDVKTGEALDTQAALNDSKWSENAAEADKYFGLRGTPGNAVINVKNGNFKAIAGAHSASEFERVVAALKAGEKLSTDDAGNAGTLTQEDIQAVLANAHFYGSADAEIVIVEYSDILCPYCQRHYTQRTLENIVDADASVAMVFKNNPIAHLHPTAPLAAKGVECAGEIAGTEAFYSYLEKAFTYSTFNGSNVAKIAEEIGLDKDAFAACFTK